ncbi:hypothetical protein [Streptomyces sp. NPDC090036]|uniref:hypothetical protein n=1 Tax=Streptomyces sp. NPDC090036 TaxID=3365926 RepID=UPI00381F124A
MASESGTARVDRRWALVVTALLLGQVAVYIWFLPHFTAASNACADSACRSGVTDAVNASAYWEVGGAAARIAALLKTPGGRTAAWRIACVLALAVCAAASMLQLD